MGLFGFGKKKEAAPVAETSQRVKVLGGGCDKCNQLEAATKEALTKLGMPAVVEHVTDWSKISAFGVMSTPALVIDDKVVSTGKVLKTAEVMALLQQADSAQ